MFNIGDTILYSKEGVCCIEAVEDRCFGGEKRTYYVLKSLIKPNSTVYVPTDNERLICGMRKILSKEEIDSIIAEVNEVVPSWIEEDAERKEEYNRIISDADCTAMCKMLKNIYYRKNKLKEQGKKLRRFDEDFFIQAQNILFNEFAHVLSIKKDEVLSYILNI